MTRPRTGGRPRTLTALKRQTAPAPTLSDWRNAAACRDGDPELFFPVGESGLATLQIEEAKKICRRCSVMETCLQWALGIGEDSGVWGGLSEDERRSMKRRAARNPA